MKQLFSGKRQESKANSEMKKTENINDIDEKSEVEDKENDKKSINNAAKQSIYNYENTPTKGSDC